MYYLVVNTHGVHDILILQLQGKDGEYLDVIPKEEVLLVNIGDLMQIWTGDRFISTVIKVNN